MTDLIKDYDRDFNENVYSNWVWSENEDAVYVMNHVDWDKIKSHSHRWLRKALKEKTKLVGISNQLVIERWAEWLYELVRMNVQAQLVYVKPWNEANNQSKRHYRLKAKELLKLVKGENDKA